MDVLLLLCIVSVTFTGKNVKSKSLRTQIMPSCRNACSFLAEKSHHRLVVGQFFLIWLVVAQLQLGNEEILSFGSC